MCSKNWHVEPVKEAKHHKYWGILPSKILKARADDNNCIVRHVEVSPTNSNLAPTIAMREPPATKDLVEGPSLQDLNLRNNCVHAKLHSFQVFGLSKELITKGKLGPQ